MQHLSCFPLKAMFSSSLPYPSSFVVRFILIYIRCIYYLCIIVCWCQTRLTIGSLVLKTIPKLYISIFGDGSHIWRFMDLSDTIKENEPMHIGYMAISFLMHIQGFFLTFQFLDSWQILCACKMGLIWSNILWKSSFWKQIYHVQPNMAGINMFKSNFSMSHVLLFFM
jgi:membrane protein CcdC involved in cytochrome C biogenesis